MVLQSEGAAGIYLDLLKLTLTRNLFDETYHSIRPRRGTVRAFLYAPIRKVLATRDYEVVRRTPRTARAEGRDMPLDAETMVGLLRLDHLGECIREVLDDGVPGDLLEAGVWRGGAAIFMRAALKAYGVTDRGVWVADSFQGLPRPDRTRYPADADDRLWSRPQLVVSIDEVKSNFRRYRLLDEQVRFVPGWFRESLQAAPIERLAILRVDADMYQSTTEVLQGLYSKVSPGGYVIIDDYGAMPSCRAAVDDFRAQQQITDELISIDWTGVCWRKTRDAEAGKA